MKSLLLMVELIYMKVLKIIIILLIMNILIMEKIHVAKFLYYILANCETINFENKLILI